MIICKNCGTVYDEYYGVCPKCGNIYVPDTEEPEHDLPKRELPDNKFHREPDPSATVIINQETPNDEDATIPNPPSPFPYQADVPPADDNNEDDDDKTLPVQPEFIPVKPEISEEAGFPPLQTTSGSAQTEAILPPLQTTSESETQSVSSQNDDLPVTMPNSQYGDAFTMGSPTSSAPSEQSVSDFANTQDIVISPAAQQPLQREPIPVQTDYSVPPVPSVPAYNSGISQEKKPKKKGSAGKIIAIILVCCVVLAGLGVGAYFLFFNNTSQEQNEDPVSLGEKYLSEENWEDAIIQFKKAIEADTNNPDLYLKLADAYEGKGDTANAILTLEQGYEKTQSDVIKARLDKLKNEHPDSTPENLQQNALSLSQAALSLYNSVKGGTINADTPTNKLNGLNPSKLPPAGALQEERDKAANNLTVQDAIIYAGLSDNILPSDIGSYVYTEDHKISYNGDAVGTTLKMDTTLGEIINGPAEKPDEDSSDQESDTESSVSSTTNELVGTWKYNYDPNLLTSEQKAMLELMGLDTAMAVMPDGTFDSYMILSGRYSKLGTGTWTLNGSDFKITTYGTTTEYEFRDGKLYDKSTNGGVYFEKISSDVPEESKNRESSEPVFESEPEEESSEPEVSDKPYDGNILGTIKFIKPAEWPDNKVAIVVYEDDIGSLFMNLLKGEDGLYYTTIMKDNDSGIIYTKPRIKFHAETSSGESFESEYFNFSGDKTYRLEKSGSKWIPVEQTGSDNTESSSVVKPSTQNSTYAATIDAACKDYYAMIIAGAVNGDKNRTQSARKKAAQNATIKEALEYYGISDHLKYLDNMSAKENGSIFYDDGTGSTQADSAKTSVVRSSNGSGKLGDLYN